MLTIVTNHRQKLSRPKYHRILDYEQWSVYDTEEKKTVFGPKSHKACILFIGKEERK
jgi:hypothetical protein